MLHTEAAFKSADENRPLPSLPVSRLMLILILGALSTVSPFSIDMYLPAFGELAKVLHTTVAKVGLSVSSYFVGLAIGQIFYGPFLDRYGRKKPLVIGLALYVAATAGCIFSSSIESLIVYRVFQAFGGCAASVASLAMVRDFFHVRESAKIFALLMLIIGVSPLLAPTLGSYVVVTLGWKAVFILLGLNVLGVLFMILTCLPESHVPDPAISLHPRAITAGFAEIFRERQFTTYAVTGALSFAGLFAYVAGSPAIFMGTYQVGAKTYGLIFAGLAVGFIGSSQLNLLLLKRFTNTQIFNCAVFAQAAVGAVFLTCAALGAMNLPVLLGFMFLFLACLGLASPNGTALAMAPFAKNAGSASALFGFLQMGVGALTSAVVGIIDLPGVLSTVIALSGSAILGGTFLVWRLLSKPPLA